MVLPQDIENIIMDYVLQLEYSDRIKKINKEIKNKNKIKKIKKILIKILFFIYIICLCIQLVLFSILFFTILLNIFYLGTQFLHK